MVVSRQDGMLKPINRLACQCFLPSRRFLEKRIGNIKSFESLLLDMVAFDPSRRRTAQELLKHGYFGTVPLCEELPDVSNSSTS